MVLAALACILSVLSINKAGEQYFCSPDRDRIDYTGNNCLKVNFFSDLPGKITHSFLWNQPFERNFCMY